MLSAISVLCGLLLFQRRSIAPRSRLAAAVGLLVPASLCFSTGGALWYLPGAAAWPQVLISVVGAFEVVVAVSAGPVVTIAVGIVGGLALMAVPWIRGLAVAVLLVLIGTLPFAVIAWWSVAAPVLAVLALGITFVVLRSDHRLQHLRTQPISGPDQVPVGGTAAPQGR